MDVNVRTWSGFRMGALLLAVGHEQITGMRRLPCQQPVRTFTASKSTTVSVDPSVLRERLLDDEASKDLFPELWKNYWGGRPDAIDEGQ